MVVVLDVMCVLAYPVCDGRRFFFVSVSLVGCWIRMAYMVDNPSSLTSRCSERYFDGINDRGWRLGYIFRRHFGAVVPGWWSKDAVDSIV
jgi:hypothetical protein